MGAVASRSDTHRTLAAATDGMKEVVDMHNFEGVGRKEQKSC